MKERLGKNGGIFIVQLLVVILSYDLQLLEVYNSQKNNKINSKSKILLLNLKDKTPLQAKQWIFIVYKIIFILVEHPFCPLGVPGHSVEIKAVSKESFGPPNPCCKAQNSLVSLQVLKGQHLHTSVVKTDFLLVTGLEKNAWKHSWHF